MLKKFVVATAFFVATFLGAAAPAVADQAAFRTADTVREIQALGAKQVAGQSLQHLLSGRSFDHPEWTWDIRANNTHFSRAKDNSWTDEGTWEIVGNQYCRSSQATQGRTLCSDVYVLGRDLRFTEDRRPRRLLDWYVSY